MKSYLPALKDKDGNKIIGLMGQYDDYDEAVTKLYGDFIFWIPLGLTTAGIVEYEKEQGLANIDITLTHPQYGAYKGAVIEGPLFEEQATKDSN